MSTKQAEANAVEFGRHVKQGGWRLGLLVACSVEVGSGHGKRGPDKSGITTKKDCAAAQSFDEKLSVAAFSRLSGIDRARLQRFLGAWDRAAAELDLWTAAELLPGDVDEIDLDAEILPDWEDYYDANPVPEHKQEAYQRAATKAGVSVKAVAAAAGRSKKAIQAAIEADEEVRDAVVEVVKTDPKTRQAARRAIEEHDFGYAVIIDKHRAQRSHEDEFVAITDQLRWAKQYLQGALGKAVNVPLHGDRGEIVLAATKELRALVEAIENLAHGGSFDDELARLLEEGAAG